MVTANLSELRDDQLIALIAQRSVEAATAEDAWCEFYTRHSEWLFRVASRKWPIDGHGLGVDDFIVETFSEVWFNASKTFRSGEYSEPTEATKHVRRWLIQIVSNLMRNALKSPRNKRLENVSDIIHEFRQPKQDQETTSTITFAEIDSIIARAVSHEDRKLVWLKLQFYDPATRRSTIPTELLDELCLELRMTKDQIRKRYQRALGEIEKELLASEVTL